MCHSTASEGVAKRARKVDRGRRCAIVGVGILDGFGDWIQMFSWGGGG